jgi:alkaline phosphatase
MSGSRRFSALVLSFAIISILASAALAQTLPAKAPDKAGNIILMIADGFGPQHFGAAWLYSDRILHKPLCMVKLMNQGHTGYMVNDTADAVVTESAAAASQMATGVKTIVGALSMSPDPAPLGTPIKTILEIAQRQGKSTGLVTTSGITDATPAAFASHALNRSMEDKIAVQELEHKVDVLMGGRKANFLPKSAAGSKRTDERDLLREAAQAGYRVVGTTQELNRVQSGKVLGLFDPGNMAHELDRNDTEQPSLAAMAHKTFTLLAKNPKGFFTMIEGGRIDHAAHRNDVAGVIHDSLAFDDAVCAAMDFQRHHPRTLLIVASDHETGGMAIIGHSKTSPATGNYVGIDLQAISKVKMTMETLMKKMRTPESPAAIKSLVKEALDVELTDDEAQMVFDDTIRKLDPANYSMGKYIHSLAFVLRPYFRVGFSTSTHTATPLFVFGAGPNSAKLVGFHHNTDIFRIMKDSILPIKRKAELFPEAPEVSRKK